MAASRNLINSYISIPQGCRKCNGTCFDANQKVRQQNFRNAFPDEALPDKCVSDSDGLVRCPAKLGAL